MNLGLTYLVTPLPEKERLVVMSFDDYDSDVATFAKGCDFAKNHRLCFNKALYGAVFAKVQPKMTSMLLYVKDDGFHALGRLSKSTGKDASARKP